MFVKQLGESQQLGRIHVSNFHVSRYEHHSWTVSEKNCENNGAQNNHTNTQNAL